MNCPPVEMPDIPDFLRREYQDQTPLGAEKLPEVPLSFTAPERTKLTGAIKDRVAAEIIAAVKSGHDTFGKLRIELGYEDRLLKSGIRHAKKWQQNLVRTGSRNKPKLHREHNRIEADGRRYRVISVIK